MRFQDLVVFGAGVAMIAVGLAASLEGQEGAAVALWFFGVCFAAAGLGRLGGPN